jgi:hypothetical protein
MAHQLFYAVGYGGNGVMYSAFAAWSRWVGGKGAFGLPIVNPDQPRPADAVQASRPVGHVPVVLPQGRNSLARLDTIPTLNRKEQDGNGIA